MEWAVEYAGIRLNVPAYSTALFYKNPPHLPRWHGYASSHVIWSPYNQLLGSAFNLLAIKCILFIGVIFDQDLYTTFWGVLFVIFIT